MVVEPPSMHMQTCIFAMAAVTGTPCIALGQLAKSERRMMVQNNLSILRGLLDFNSLLTRDHVVVKDRLDFRLSRYTESIVPT